MLARVSAVALVVVGGAVAVVRGLAGVPNARLGATVLVPVVAALAVGLARGRAWARGAAFLIAVCAAWAVAALGLRHEVSAMTAAAGLAWTVGVAATALVADGRVGTTWPETSAEQAGMDDDA